jgi:hypothetical protein
LQEFILGDFIFFLTVLRALVVRRLVFQDVVSSLIRLWSVSNCSMVIRPAWTSSMMALSFSIRRSKERSNA